MERRREDDTTRGAAQRAPRLLREEPRGLACRHPPHLFPPSMPQRPRSLKHEYELYVEEEIENYKESIPRSAILAIGDEAAARLAAESQFTLTELLLVEEVDRIVAKRIRLPKYDTWRKKRTKLLDEMRRPEHWGLQKGDALVRTVENAIAEKITAHVLVAGDTAERSALY